MSNYRHTPHTCPHCQRTITPVFAGHVDAHTEHCRRVMLGPFWAQWLDEQSEKSAQADNMVIKKETINER